MKRLSLLSVVGARPQFIKLAPVCRALQQVIPHANHRILHTGQHYDYGMSDVFFENLGIPTPDVSLNVGSGSHGAQTGAMIRSIEEHLLENRPDGVIVFGDTNSTIAASLAASKLHISLFHIEAGLRSFDRRMPEEVNRIVADHCSDRLFAPTDEAMRNLAREGLADRAVQVGDVMYDAVLHTAGETEGARQLLSEHDLVKGHFGVVTVHRASNTNPDVLEHLMHILTRISDDVLPLIFPMHPRTREAVGDRLYDQRNLHIVPPQSYATMLSLVRDSKVVLTDSGGLQKESFFLLVPCITLRESTEWIETVECGANIVAGLSEEKITSAINEVCKANAPNWSGRIGSLYGDGKASEKIARTIGDWLCEN